MLLCNVMYITYYVNNMDTLPRITWQYVNSFRKDMIQWCTMGIVALDPAPLWYLCLKSGHLVSCAEASSVTVTMASVCCGLACSLPWYALTLYPKLYLSVCACSFWNIPVLSRCSVRFDACTCVVSLGLVSVIIRTPLKKMFPFRRWQKLQYPSGVVMWSR